MLPPNDVDVLSTVYSMNTQKRSERKPSHSAPGPWLVLVERAKRLNITHLLIDSRTTTCTWLCLAGEMTSSDLSTFSLQHVASSLVDRCRSQATSALWVVNGIVDSEIAFACDTGHEKLLRTLENWRTLLVCRKRKGATRVQLIYLDRLREFVIPKIRIMPLTNLIPKPRENNPKKGLIFPGSPRSKPGLKLRDCCLQQKRWRWCHRFLHTLEIVDIQFLELNGLTVINQNDTFTNMWVATQFLSWVFRICWVQALR